MYSLIHIIEQYMYIIELFMYICVCVAILNIWIKKKSDISYLAELSFT